MASALRPIASTNSRTRRPWPWSAALALCVATILAACGGSDSGGTDPNRGDLQVTIAGLPSGLDAEVTVTGPNGFSRSLAGTQTLGNLAPGNYTVSAQLAEGATAIYGASPSSQVLAIQANQTAQANVTYAQVTGSINVAISGLPGGVDAVVRVSKSSPAFTQTLAASATLSKLTPGTYSVTADTVEVAGIKHIGTPRTQTVVVLAGPTPAQAAVSYILQPGSLRVIVNGLPPAYPADIVVTGPGGFNQAVTGTTTLANTPAGSYTVAADQVTNGPDTFNPSPLSQTLEVSVGAQSQATVTYASTSPVTLNLAIGRFYITQSTQRADGSVPLVAGREGLVRVFVVANQANSAQPDVRIRFWQGATMVREELAASSLPSVPVAIQEDPLGSSWNLTVESGFLQTGMSISVDVDPADEINESAEGDNSLTLNQQPKPLDVRVSPAFNLRLVPVIQTGVPNAQAGDVSDPDSWVEFARRIHPLDDINVDVHAPFATGIVLQAGGDGWVELLGALQVLRSTEGSPRYYYGALDVNYMQGVAGIGYVPNSPFDSDFRVAMGWDYPGTRSEIAGHEWGHNFGRLHAPCGGPSGVDPSWPVSSAYQFAAIGQWGYDIENAVLVEPSGGNVHRDVMSYCDPQWISDYTYTGVQEWRAAAGASVQGSGGPVEGLLVWGRIVDGKVILEPAFEVTAPATPAAGEWTLEVTDETGARVAEHRFAVAEIADLSYPASTFAFVVPLDRARRERAAGLKVRGPAGQAELRAVPAPPGAAVVAPTPAAERAAGRVRLRWDAARFGAVLVRDAATGEVLTIGSGGEAMLVEPRGDLDVTLSDGVRSARQRIRIR